MTCDRVYRKAMPVDVAREELRKCAGTQFDPRVVDALLGWLEECDHRGEAVENDHFASLVRGLSERKLV
jgi:HD-GYP domain-containing protein (c-di-GMP phosphodiesterase class II)